MKIKQYCIFITGCESKETFNHFSDFIRMYNELENDGDGFIAYMILENGARVNFE